MEKDTANNATIENECMLTTFDNPFNPFEDFIAWFLFDEEKGYKTCSYIARLVNIEEDFTQKEIDDEIERVIDEIIFYDPIDIYKKVWKNATN